MGNFGILLFSAAIPLYFMINAVENRILIKKGGSELYQKTQQIALQGNTGRANLPTGFSSSEPHSASPHGFDFPDHSADLAQQHALDAANPYITPGVDVSIDETYHGHDQGLGIVNPEHNHNDAGPMNDHNNW